MTTSGLRAHVTADGAFLRFLDLPGTGPPLVWVHGWQCSSTGELLPAAVQPPLRSRRSLLVDLLGHGYSDRPADFSYTVPDHARTVVDLISALGLDECGLVGHSMGGEICVRVAAALPSVVTLLVMVEGTLDPHGEEVFDGQTEDDFAGTGFAALLATLRSRAAADPSGVPAVHLGLTSGLEPRAVFREDVSMRDGSEPAARSLLADLTAERWYLWGALSEPEPEFDRGLEDLGVRVVRVPGTGHAMGLQNPAGLATTIAGIIDGGWPRGRRPGQDGQVPERLTADEVAAVLQGLPRWSGDTDGLRRTVELPTFRDAVAAITRIADVAEELDHHPDVDLRWRTLHLAVVTHSAGGVTGNDVELARRIDALLPG